MCLASEKEQPLPELRFILSVAELEVWPLLIKLIRHVRMRNHRIRFEIFIALGVWTTQNWHWYYAIGNPIFAQKLGSFLHLLPFFAHF